MYQHFGRTSSFFLPVVFTCYIAFQLGYIRTRVAPVKTNMVKWGKTNSDDLYCGCGEVQDMGPLLSCRDCPQNCTLEDLWLANKKGFDVAQYWAKNL
jgi:hypothetical protein